MTTTFSAPDIECGGCANAIKKALGRVDGVSDIAVDVDRKLVTVVGDAPADTVLATLDKAGFPATVTASAAK